MRVPLNIVNKPKFDINRYTPYLEVNRNEKHIMLISNLPQPYKELALEQRDDDSSHEDSLTRAFLWDSTPEGHEFWNAVDMANSEDQLPPIPEPSLKQKIKEIIDQIPELHDHYDSDEARVRDQALTEIYKLIT